MLGEVGSEYGMRLILRKKKNKIKKYSIYEPVMVISLDYTHPTYCKVVSFQLTFFFNPCQQ